MGLANTAVTAARRRKRNTMARREATAFYLFASPWIIGFIIFSLGPILAAGYFSLTDLQVLNINNGLPNFIGLRNYQDLLNDRSFILSLKATAIFTIGGLIINTTVAILLAQLLNQRLPGLRFFRTIYYMPTVVAGVAAGYIWLFMLRTNDGLLNGILGAVHIQGPDWLGSETFAPIALLLYNMWYVGQSVVIYLAAVQGVPTALYEAASIDGANAFSRFWHITLPMISPVILFNVVIGLINLLQAFVPPFVITQGGPNYSTWLYGFGIYQTAFNYQHGGYAATWAMVLFVVSMISTIVILLGASRFVHYQGERGGVI